MEGLPLPKPEPKPIMMVIVTFACPGLPEIQNSAHDVEGIYPIGGPNKLVPPESIECDEHQVTAPRVAMHNLQQNIDDLEELERLRREIRKDEGFSDN